MRSYSAGETYPNEECRRWWMARISTSRASRRSPAANPCWYAWRAWIEQGFQTAKRAGLDWQHTRLTMPERAERHFLAIAVTLLWLVAVGAEGEQVARVETIGPLPAEAGEGKERGRRIRRFVQGVAAVLAA